LIISPTGSGKTEAALFPILDIIQKNNWRGLKVIYVSPLRALNRDIFRRMIKLSEALGINMKVRHGDTPETERSLITQQPPEILITTPETLDALCVIENFNKHFSNLEFLIIDEVHELFEGRRGLHLLLTLNRLKEFKKHFRIIGLSATISNIKAISETLFGREDFIVLNEETERTAQVVIAITKNIQDFSNKVKSVLEVNRSAIIFANTRSMAETLAFYLKGNLNFEIAIHHGSLGKDVREDVESKLKEGKLKAVIATSSLEYGIDIPYVDIVIQYGSPIQAKIFKQRVGRSQHRIGLKPKGIIFSSNPIESLESYVIAINSNFNKLEDEYISKSLDILIHHIIGLLLINKKISLKEIYSKIKNIDLYKELNEESFSNLIDNMAKNKLILLKGEEIYPLRARAIPYYFNTISTIFEEPLYSCIDIYDRKLIGKVDGRIIFDCYDNNLALVLAGKSWKVVNINDEKSIAELAPLGAEAEIPIWIGEMLPVSKEVSEEVFDMIPKILRTGNIEFLRTGDVFFEEEALKSLMNFINNIVLNSPYIPSSKIFVIEKYENFYAIINPRGTKINRGIAILLKGLLKGRILEIIPTAYGIIIELRESLSFDSLIKHILNIPKIASQSSLLSELLFDDYNFLSLLKQVSIFTGNFKKESFKELNSKVLKSLRNTFTEEIAVEIFTHDYIKLGEIVELINSLGKDIKILCYETRMPSPIFSLFLSKLPSLREAIQKDTTSIFDAVEKRLEEEEMLFVCTVCKTDFMKKIKEVEENPVCSRCGSKKIAVINPYDEGLMKVVQAFKKSNMKDLKKMLNDYERFLLSSELIARYGKTAALVMAGRGIGPEFARRILVNWNGKKNDLIKEIIKFEINYAKTRKYWGD